MGTASTATISGYRNPPPGSDSSLEWATETTAIGVVVVAAVGVTLEVVTVVVVAAVACVVETIAAAVTVVTAAAVEEGEEVTTAVMAEEATTVGVTPTHLHQLPLT